MENDKLAESLKKVMTTLVDKIKEERSKTDSYKGMFEALQPGEQNFEGIFRKIECEIMGIVLDACQVIEDKTGKPLTNEAFDFLFMIPLYEKYLSKMITESEGFSCCIDKAYWIMNEHFKKLMEDKKE